MTLKLDANTGKWIDDGLTVQSQEAASQPGAACPTPGAACPTCGQYPKPKTDINDDTALKGLAIDVLVQIIENAPRNVSLVAAIRELMDRAVGKAPQSIAMTVRADPVSKLSDDQLEAILANLPTSPLIIPPLPKKIDE